MRDRIGLQIDLNYGNSSNLDRPSEALAGLGLDPHPVTQRGSQHIVALHPQETGFRLTTLCYDAEIHTSAPYFADIKAVDVNPDQLALATQLVEGLSKPFDPAQFHDRYQEALLEVIKSKIEGSDPAVIQTAEAGKVVSLMDALQQSVAQTKGSPAAGAGKKKPPAASVRPAKSSKKKKVA